MKLPKNRYLGKLCKRGHDYKGTGKSLRIKPRSTSTCTECRLSYQRKWKKRNLEQAIEATKRWRRNNPGYSTRYNREYRKKYGARVKALSKIYARTCRVNHPEVFKEREKKAFAKKSSNLTDGYIRSVLVRCDSGKNELRKQLPQELIEVKRLQIQIQRFIRKGGE